MKVINLLNNPKAIKSNILPGNTAMLLLELGWLVQTHRRYLQSDPTISGSGLFSVSYTEVSKISFPPVHEC